MKDYKNLVVKSETNWLHIAFETVCFVGSMASIGFLLCLLAV
jgi:hypothetical protein